MNGNVKLELERLESLFAQRLEKIAELEDFISLYGEKAKLIEQLLELQDKTSEQKQQLEECREAVHHFYSVSKPKYDVVLAKMRNQQLVMLAIMEELDKREDTNSNAVALREQNTQNAAAAAVNQSNAMLSPLKGVNELGQPTITPRTCLKTYINSPFVRRIKPIAIQFVDFEAQINPAQFAKIPPYMKGRDTIVELQYFLDSVIVKCFSTKYALFHKERDAVRNQHDLALWKLYHTQKLLFPFKQFITEGDISNLTKKLVDKKTSSRIVMLRHIQIIQEVRKNSTAFYIWLHTE